MKKLKLILMILTLVIASRTSMAGPVHPLTFSFDGQLTDLADAPVVNSNIVLNAKIYDPTGSACLLYEEQQTVNTTSTNGHFHLDIGSATGNAKRQSQDPGLSMKTIFDNSGAQVRSSGTNCAGGYTPSANDKRMLVVTVVSVGGSTYNNVLSAQPIQSVPFAMSADNVQGKEAADFINVNGAMQVTQSNVETVFNDPDLMTLLAGTNTMYMTKPANQGTTLPTYAGVNPSGAAAGQIWYDTITNQVKYHNGTAAQTLGGGGGSVTSVSVTAPITDSGTATAPVIGISDASVAAKGVVMLAPGGGTTAGTVVQANDARLSDSRPPSGSASGDLTGTYPNPTLTTTGVGAGSYGSASNVTTFTVDSKGRLTAAASSTPIAIGPDQVNANGAGKYLDYRPNGNACAPGGVLKWNNSSLHWECGTDLDTTNPGTVTQVTVSSPLGVINGTSTPALSISQANGSTDGYLSSGDWTAFNNKQVAGNYITALTGDVTATGPGSSTATIASNAVTSAKILDNTIGAADLAASSVTSAKISDGAVTTPKMFANPGINYLVSTDGTTGANLAPFSCPPGEAAVYQGGTGWGCSAFQAPLGFTPVNQAGDTMSGSLNVNVSGGAALPSVAVNTINGLYSPAAGRLGISSNGFSRMVFDENGNVGVGTSNPGANFHINGTSTAPMKLQSNAAAVGVNLANGLNESFIYSGSAGGNPSFHVDTGNNGSDEFTVMSYSAMDGKVGINERNPWANLQVSSEKSGGYNDPTGIYENYSSDSQGPVLELRKAHGFKSAPNAVISGDHLGSVQFRGFSNIGFSSGAYPGARIRGVATENWTNMAQGTKMEFSTMPNGGVGAALQTRMTIDQNGNVGIGMPSPDSKLVVNGDSRNSFSGSNAGMAIDFSTSNLQYTTSNCGAFTLNNLKDGGSYTLAVKGVTSSMCSFSGSGMTYHLPPSHGMTVSGKHTLYTFLVMGSDVYVSWIPGL